MAVALGASCDFLTPIGHQNNNLQAMGPGGYRFGDYWRLGLPLSVLVAVLGSLLIVVGTVTGLRRQPRCRRLPPLGTSPPGRAFSRAEALQRSRRCTVVVGSAGAATPWPGAVAGAGSGAAAADRGTSWPDPGSARSAPTARPGANSPGCRPPQSMPVVSGSAAVATLHMARYKSPDPFGNCACPIPAPPWSPAPPASSAPPWPAAFAARGHALRLLVRRRQRPRATSTGWTPSWWKATSPIPASLARAVAGCRYRGACRRRLPASGCPTPPPCAPPTSTGTEALMRAALAAGVERIVYCSSVAALGLTGDATPGRRADRR